MHNAKVFDVSEVHVAADIDDLGWLFDVCPLPMWVYEVETLRILRANRAAQLEYGWSAEEFAALTIDDVRPPEDVAIVHDVLAGLRQLGPDADEELHHNNGWRHCRRDGSVMYVDLVSRGIIINGVRMRWVIVRDETARFLAEEQRDHLLREVLDGHELLRSGIALRLHDGPAQALTAVALRLGLLRRSLPPDVQPKVAEIEMLVSNALVDVRAEMNHQRPPTDLAPDLAGAIRELLVRRQLDDHYIVTSSGEEPSPSVIRLLYRVAEGVFAGVAAAPVSGEPCEVRIDLSPHEATMLLPVGADVDIDAQTRRLIEVIDGRIERLAEHPLGTLLITVPVLS